ncbi:DUF4251 domain-containing protein [Ekhidna sp.]|uniref:DUF4251 domain-containing protein n=1 Tax=Ekhidna sp. TaxID=2608089 RepID=UPI003CCBDEC9
MFFSLGVMAQSVDSESLSPKELRKLERQQKAKEQLDSIKTMIEDQAFALEANMLRSRTAAFNVMQQNNFIKVEGDEVVIQTANASRVGMNGMGGVTVNGRLMTYDISSSKRGINVTMIVSSFALGNLNINLSVNASGNATASINGSFGLRATFQGDLVALNNISQFEGTSIF